MVGRRRLLGKVLVVLLGAALLSPALAAVTARAAHADPGSEEARFLALTNQLRASKGLSTLATSGEVLSVARRWAYKMAGDGAISHNMNLPNEVALSWTKLGENVGTGSTVDAIQDAFIKSPTHYKNLVDPAWNYIGIGVVDVGSRIYVTVDFMQYGDSSASAAPAPAPVARQTRSTAPRPAPVPRAAPVAAPPPPPPPAAPEEVAPPVPSAALTLALNQLRAFDESY